MKSIKEKKITPMPSNQEAEIAVLGSVLLEGAEIYEKAKSWLKDESNFLNRLNQSSQEYTVLIMGAQAKRRSRSTSLVKASTWTK